MILVVAEQREGKLNRASWETIAGAQQAGEPITLLVPGDSVSAIAGELAAAEVNEVIALEAPALEPYTPDGYVAALAAVIGELSPSLVLLPHTYQTRDFAPALAARLERAIITDCVAIKRDGGTRAFVRPMFQGKLSADVLPEGPAPHLIGAKRPELHADEARRGPVHDDVGSELGLEHRSHEDPFVAVSSEA
ncbi:MAG: electron transfer flavoprotein subunit alpha/FixB family protein, partial [Vicinamibacterales bacterium]